MVGEITQDSLSSIDLLKQEHTSELMRKSHCRKADPLRARSQNLRGQTIRAANNKGRTLAQAKVASSQKLRKFPGSKSRASRVQRYGQIGLLQTGKNTDTFLMIALLDIAAAVPHLRNLNRAEIAQQAKIMCAGVLPVSRPDFADADNARPSHARALPGIK